MNPAIAGELSREGRLNQTVDESSKNGFDDIIIRVRALKEVMPI